MTTESTPKIEPGQLWLPKPNTAAPSRGGGPLRIICHYDYPRREGQTIWVVEYLNYVHRLERMDQEALLGWWHLAEEAD